MPETDPSTLDLSPEQFRALGHRAVDLLAEQLRFSHSASARNPVSGDLRASLLHQPLPKQGRSPDEILSDFAARVLPHPLGNNSPRFFAWVNSPAAPFGVLAELLAAGMNSSVAGGDHAATYVEHAVLGWLKQLLGFPESAGGILASGGSVANLVGLAVMRHVKARGDARKQGFRDEPEQMTIYTSAQGHSCIQKAVELLGFGSDSLRRVPVDSEFRMDMEVLGEQVRADRAAGLRPVCVAASAGTVNTGAIDPLAAIADFCAQEDLWFHVDGAYGAPGILARQTTGLHRGMERADSLAADPHKWFYVPVECGAVFIRNAQTMRDTFSVVPPYLRDDTALPWFSEFGIQQTRGFRALKLWFTLQQIGSQGYEELISRDIELACSLRTRIRTRGDFELVSDGPLSVTCFRYAPPGATDPDGLNRRLLDLVQREGKVFLTSTELNGRFVLRACIVNFRTNEADLDLLLATLADAGRRVFSEPSR